MKAMLWTAYGPPEVLQLGRLPTPEPKRDQVRIRMHATAVTYSDTFVRALPLKPFTRFVARSILGFRRPKRWPVLGIVVAGEIDRIGAGVTSFREGDQVFGMNPFGAGAYAEYLCMKAGKLLATKPTNLTYREAAALPYGGLLALHFLRAAGIAPDMRVLIYGASGATGSAAVQLAKHFGAQVTGVCSARNLDLVKSLGADAVIDYTSRDFTTMGDRYDLVFAAVGGRYHPPSAEACRGVLTSGGDAPGMNAAIRAVVRYAIGRGLEVIGIRRGYTGLLANELQTLTRAGVANVIQRGGTILGTSRCEEFLSVEGRSRAATVETR